jgi:hypothetical protein
MRTARHGEADPYTIGPLTHLTHSVTLQWVTSLHTSGAVLSVATSEGLLSLCYTHAIGT